ncbi:ABC transporter ATP-binding protein [Pararhizobium mangrovi]|uniref:ABC transporter ATP-binding protein n=1 Tax=Pararhizobium mangrovi TaxID=2590452 RepID=A0A506U8I6_9HYPH|nr:ABC transporter ATP-binding protein [Pararhizobium mangrovi]TPW30210.1 ABC transporter ATP-binding protein [Pararhizobium mangrovi]
MSEPVLKVRDLSVVLERNGRDFPVLDGVTFDIAPGEVLGLVGESGAGKSMTGIAIIDLLVPPLRRTSGTIALSGERLDQLSAKRMRRVRGKRIGFVFQDPMTSLNPVLSIGRQLTDTMRRHLPLTRGEARERAIAWLTRVGLANPPRVFAAAPHELSGGQRQRIVIALALCAEPDLLIADEPTTALDVSVQAHMLTLLRELHEETGTAMMLITHDLGVIAKMADRVAVFYAGRVIETAPTGRLIGAPLHPYTAGLMQATPAPDADGAMRVRAIPGAMPGIGALPPGCAFHPRCERAQAICREERPPLADAGGHDAACYFPLVEEVVS